MVEVHLHSPIRFYDVVLNCLINKHRDNFIFFTLILYNEMLVPSPSPVTKDHPLSTVRCAYEITCRQEGCTDVLIKLCLCVCVCVCVCVRVQRPKGTGIVRRKEDGISFVGRISVLF
jgi:hypothetical protein